MSTTANPKALIALTYICFIWGTTYLAIRIGVLHFPAFLFAGIRQSIAGLLLIPFALYFNKQKDLSLRNIGRQMLIGFLMLTLGNGCVSWGEKFVPSGVAALICSIMPMFAVGFNLISNPKDHFNLLIALGMFLGVAGVALIFRQNLADLGNPAYLKGMASVFLATCTWALGSIINKKDSQARNPMFNSALQLFFGGIFMLLLSPWVDDLHHINWHQPHAFAALLYLIIFGSLIAYAAYMYALTHLPLGLATIYAYINPMVAVVLGFLVLHETLNLFTALSFIAIALGVWLVNRGYKKAHQKSA
jgi:drug/metabolite transporter (DMT)-like permease